jgi:Helicase conserved C-terminal domain
VVVVVLLVLNGCVLVFSHYYTCIFVFYRRGAFLSSESAHRLNLRVSRTYVALEVEEALYGEDSWRQAARNAVGGEREPSMTEYYAFREQSRMLREDSVRSTRLATLLDVLDPSWLGSQASQDAGYVAVDWETLLCDEARLPSVPALVATLRTTAKKALGDEVVDAARRRFESLQATPPTTSTPSSGFPSLFLRPHALGHASFRVTEQDGSNRALSRAIAFAGTTASAKAVATHLRRFSQERGRRVAQVHSGADDAERQAAVDAFRRLEADVLVCTDVVSRGVDLPGTDHVIEVDFSPDAVTHLHRIGRTGRMGAAGHVTALAGPDDTLLLASLLFAEAAGAEQRFGLERVFSRKRGLRKRIKKHDQKALEALDAT